MAKIENARFWMIGAVNMQTMELAPTMAGPIVSMADAEAKGKALAARYPENKFLLLQVTKVFP